MSSDYVRRLVTTCPEIREIWLIGSRANGTAKEDSDWDYIVFGNKSVLAELQSDHSLNEPEIDLMIVYNDDDFREPWGDQPKHGSLSKWEWQQVSSICARYRAAKWKDDKIGVEVTRQKAIRIWHKEI